MKQIAFASGKGGAGKTSLSLSFHKFLAANSIFADCDVDAADAFLLLEDEQIEVNDFYSGLSYTIDNERCTNCGACQAACHFDAIKQDEKYYIAPLLCEGCGACEDRCKYQAINSTKNHCGYLYHSKTKCASEMIYARLTPAEDNSGKLVHQVRDNVKKRNQTLQKEFIILDCPPGIGCPLMASITGIDLLVVIVECSQAGFNDAKRLIQLAQQMKIPIKAILNKAELLPQLDLEIELYLKMIKVPISGIIPFNAHYNDILNQKKLLIDSEIHAPLLKETFSNIRHFS